MTFQPHRKTATSELIRLAVLEDSALNLDLLTSV